MITNRVVHDLPSKQRAAQYDPKENTVSVRQIPVPSIRVDELLVKVSSASLCHSDMMLFEPNEQGLILSEKPVTMGHEAVGKVLKVGDEKKGVKPGDTVCILWSACKRRSSKNSLHVTLITTRSASCLWSTAALTVTGVKYPIFSASWVHKKSRVLV